MNCLSAITLKRTIALAITIALAHSVSPAISADSTSSVSSPPARLRQKRAELEELNQIIKRNPKSSEAFGKRATTYLALNNPYGAKQDIDRALALNDKNAEAYNALGLLKFHYAKDIEGAISAFSRAIALRPKYVPAIRHRGILEFHQNRYVKAKADLDRAIALDPKHSDSFNTRGRVYHALNDYKRAIADFDRSIALDPKYDSPYNNKALALVKLGRFQEAVDWYTRAIAINPAAQAYCNRGTAYIRMKRNAEGERDLKKALAIDPKHLNAHNNLGALYHMTKRDQEAKAQFSQAIAIEPNDSRSRRNRGLVLAKEGDFEEALFDLNQTYQGEARTEKVLERRDFQSVVKSCTKMIRLHPGNQDTYYDRGFAYFCMRDWNSALADFDMFRTRSATTSKAGINAAILSNFAFRRQDLKTEAKQRITEVLKKTPPASRQYWAYKFAEYLNEKRTIDSLQSLDLNLTGKTELKCFLAIDLAIAGDRQGALTELNWIKDHGDRGIDEYELAIAELAELKKRKM